MNNHERWMSRAIEEAIVSARSGDGPIAAVIIQHDRLISIGRNTKTSENSGIAHAELNALLAAKHLLGRKPTGCILYTTMEPCAMCLGAITFSGIRKIVYGSSDPEGGAVSMFAQHGTYGKWMPEIIGDVLQKECDALKSLPTFKGKTPFIIQGER